MFDSACPMNYLPLGWGALGSVSNLRASLRYLTAALTSSKLRELTAYFANFWASVCARVDG